MKRHNNLYAKIYDFENLHLAYLQARKCKRYRRDVLKFSANLEENLRIKHYIRYMDDVIILHQDKKYLHEMKNKIESFVNNALNLHLNNKTAVRPVTTGVPFVGFGIWCTHKRMKKKSLKKMKKRLKYIKKAYARGEMKFNEIDATMQSYLGIMKQFNSYKLKKKMLRDFILKKDNLISRQNEKIAELVNENFEKENAISALTEDLLEQ